MGARGSRREGRAPRRGHIAPNRPNGPPCQEPAPVSGLLCALGLPSSPWQRFNGELRFYPRQPPARVAWGAWRCPLEERPGAEKLPLHPPRRCLCLPICLSRCCSMCCLHSPASRRGCLRGAFQQAARPRGWGERVWGTPPRSQPPSRPEHGGELPSKHPAVRSGSWHVPLRTSALLLLPTPCPLRLPTRPRSQPGLAAATGLALRPRAGCQHPQVLTALLLGGPAAAPLLLWPSRGLCGVLGSPGLCYPLCVPPS